MCTKFDVYLVIFSFLHEISVYRSAWHASRILIDSSCTCRPAQLLYVAQMYNRFRIFRIIVFFFTFSGDMIRLFKVKEKQRELAENANGASPVKKQSAGELRLHRGLHSL